MEAERLEHVRREADKMRAKAEQATPQRAGWDGACDGWARGRMAEPAAFAAGKSAKGRPGSLSRRLGWRGPALMLVPCLLYRAADSQRAEPGMEAGPWRVWPSTGNKPRGCAE